MKSGSYVNPICMNNIEVEIRSFISEEQYKKLIERFKKEAQFLGEDEQITYYFDCPQDLRIQKNTTYSKVWLKKGKLHDDHREEIEVRYAKDDFEKMEQLFLALGYKPQIKWFRTRHSFKWNDIDVAVDYTRGYGYIIELEKMSSEAEKESVLAMLKEKLEGIGVSLTPKDEFAKRFEHYKTHWQELV